MKKYIKPILEVNYIELNKDVANSVSGNFSTMQPEMEDLGTLEWDEFFN